MVRGFVFVDTDDADRASSDDDVTDDGAFPLSCCARTEADPARHISEAAAPCPYCLAPCPNSLAPRPIYIAPCRIKKKKNFFIHIIAVFVFSDSRSPTQLCPDLVSFACWIVPEFWSFTRKDDLVVRAPNCARFLVVCALNCAWILVVRTLDCALPISQPSWNTATIFIILEYDTDWCQNIVWCSILDTHNVLDTWYPFYYHLVACQNITKTHTVRWYIL